jgi:spore maturation protein CgeB
MSGVRLVVLGLSLSSSWGNGHATTYRSLLKAFARRGHDVLFLERDVPWYAQNRDLARPGWCRLELYRDLDDLARFLPEIAAADAVIVGSYVPEGVEVSRLVAGTARGVTAFYDIDTPITLAKLAAGDYEYVSPEVIPGFDYYLSFTGGPALDVLESRYGARAARPLYCTADTGHYRPVEAPRRWDLSYLGTYSDDRQPKVERLLIDVARRAPQLRFCVAGPSYPASIDWPPNVERIDHVGPADHPAFYASSRFTLNVTRAEMVRFGHSPSVRLFEAAACGTAILSDDWAGLDDLFTLGREMLTVSGTDDVLACLALAPEEVAAVAAAGRARVLAEHSADRRAAELEAYLRSRPDRTSVGARLDVAHGI